ncbi:MAG: DinB family protein [Deltaproteobacteria bacterium]|jgi:uncharacterized damage-inducible protein DinB|nr:DinB family protein [Deltaproteobacteria bacterium]
MSRTITETLIPAVFSSLELVKKVTNVCPDTLWTEKAGAWPLWQHLAHTISGTDFFVPGQSVNPPASLPPEVAQLKAIGLPVSKKELSDFLEAVTTKLGQFLAQLQDEDLVKPNEKIQKVGLDFTLGRTLIVLAAHPLYHIGHADAVLRQAGLNGVF